jgi:hypothetical protein
MHLKKRPVTRGKETNNRGNETNNRGNVERSKDRHLELFEVVIHCQEGLPVIQARQKKRPAIGGKETYYIGERGRCASAAGTAGHSRWSTRLFRKRDLV